MSGNQEHRGRSSERPYQTPNQEELAEYADLHQTRKIYEEQIEHLRRVLNAQVSEEPKAVARKSIEEYQDMLFALDEQIEYLNETRPKPTDLN